jgi:hypothetical protein
MKFAKMDVVMGLAFWVVLYYLIIHFVFINGKNYQLLMSPHLFHDFCHFLWLLVINIQFFCGRRFFQESHQIILLGLWRD